MMQFKKTHTPQLKNARNWTKYAEEEGEYISLWRWVENIEQTFVKQSKSCKSNATRGERESGGEMTVISHLYDHRWVWAPIKHPSKADVSWKSPTLFHRWHEWQGENTNHRHVTHTHTHTHVKYHNHSHSLTLSHIQSHMHSHILCRIMLNVVFTHNSAFNHHYL